MLAFFAFLSGIVTILSPCILPVLPLILSGSVGGKSKPLGVIIGFSGSFSLFTLFLSALVEILSLPPEALRTAAVALIGVFGIILLFPSLQEQWERFSSRFIRKKGGSEKSGFRGGLLTGMSLGLLWTPCVGPIMASVITLAVSRNVDGGAVLIILSYSLGTSLPMFALMAGGRKLLNRFPRLTSRAGSIQRVFGLVMIATALMIASGADRKIQTALLEAFPRYGSGLTSFENIEPVKKALERRNGTTGKLQPDKPGNYGPAPELIAEGPWINTAKDLTMDDLMGKVVLVDFWTYSCINCIRTIPYLREWYDRYSAQGLEIIAIHSPEFPFERNRGNVEKAVNDLGVDWPVVLDNSFAQWNHYGNRFWPAHYFIDARGNIRYAHFGEGAYEESEKVIVSLLKEAGYDPAEPMEGDREVPSSVHTREIYLGYARASGFLESDPPRDRSATFRFTDPEEEGLWSLEGNWMIRNDFIETDGDGDLKLKFKANGAFVVLESLEEGSRISVTIDGLPAGDTADVSGGLLVPGQSGLYRLMETGESSEHLLQLRIQGRVRLYTFTFE
ncbi:MAG: redoxin domain-containing protein [Spirochaetales bacterium]|nr:redoxin domain-containing protein [Spirochaetales bacterium]